jgi:hypothetical protein
MATDATQNARLIARVCAERLPAGLRFIDAIDVRMAPILRGREGEDVCAWAPPWYDGILRATLGWAFR